MSIQLDAFQTTGTSPPTKVCRKCGAKKPLDGFYRDATSKDSRRSDCKECNRERVTRWYAANPERKRETDARYHAANRERRREASAHWRAENPERKREINARYQAEQWRQAIAIFQAAGAWCGHEGPYNIDHIHGDGEIERRLRSNGRRSFSGYRIAADVVKNPERAGRDLQLLCVPCHAEKTRRDREWLRQVDGLTERTAS